MGICSLARLLLLLVAAAYGSIAAAPLPALARNEAPVAGSEITVAALPREAQQWFGQLEWRDQRQQGDAGK